MFGLRKRLAEVSITRKVSTTVSQNKNNDEKDALLTISDEELSGLIKEVYDPSAPEVKIPTTHLKKDSLLLANGLTFGAWIHNDQVHIQENEQRLPIIEAGENVTVLVNEEKLIMSKAVTSQDLVTIKLKE